MRCGSLPRRDVNNLCPKVVVDAVYVSSQAVQAVLPHATSGVAGSVGVHHFLHNACMLLFPFVIIWRAGGWRERCVASYMVHRMRIGTTNGFLLSSLLCRVIPAQVGIHASLVCAGAVWDMPYSS